MRLRLWRQISSSSRILARPPSELSGLSYLTSERDHAAARTWAQSFTLDDIPKDSLEISYSRSSGPGGQHVNKTNSKATVRCRLDGSGSWLPSFVLAPLRTTQYHVTPSSLLISSQTSRSAPQNLQAAMKTLHETILSAANSKIVGQTSAQQKSRVQGLIKADEGRRRVQKDKRASKKASRRDD